MNNINKDSRHSDVSEWKSPRLVSDKLATENAGISADKIRQDAYDESFNKGYEAGQELAKQELADQLLSISDLLDTLSKPFNDQNQQLTEYLTLLAGRIAKALVQHELHTDPQSLMAIVRQTVAALNTNHHEICVHLNPKNARVIRDLVNVDSKEQSWKIIEDPLVSYNECKVNSQDSVIDVELDDRINLIISQLLDHERNGSKE